jgi:hypothetical protein
MAPEKAVMILRQDYVEDNTENLSPLDEKELECFVISETQSGNLNVKCVESFVDSAS